MALQVIGGRGANCAALPTISGTYCDARANRRFSSGWRTEEEHKIVLADCFDTLAVSIRDDDALQIIAHRAQYHLGLLISSSI